MLQELRTAYPEADIRILAVNAAGYESGNSRLPAAGNIPALQDTVSQNVTQAWSTTYRDVVLVDAAGQRVEAYNLTRYSLGVSANYATLKAKIEALVSQGP